MQTVIASMVFVLLVGCTTSSIGDGQPTLSLTTNKQPAPYILCVLPKWQESSAQPVMSQITGGYRLVLGSADRTDDILVVTGRDGGSSVNLYHRPSFVPGLWRGSVDVAVRNCL